MEYSMRVTLYYLLLLSLAFTTGCAQSGTAEEGKTSSDQEEQTTKREPIKLTEADVKKKIEAYFAGTVTEASSVRIQQIISSLKERLMSVAMESVKAPEDVEKRFEWISTQMDIAGVFFELQDVERAMTMFDDSAELVAEVIASGQTVPPERHTLVSVMYYNKACVQALQGEAQKALETLKTSVDYGFDRLMMVRQDSDLEKVRALPNFEREIVEPIKDQLRKNAVADISPKPLFPFDFELPAPTGEIHTLDQYAGKVRIVDLWGTWCPPCRMEIPSFIELQNKYGAEGFQVIGLNQNETGTQEDQAETISKAMDQLKINYPCLISNRETLDQAAPIEGFPTTLFLDRAGNVRLKVNGYQEYEYLEAAVKALLSESSS